MNIDIIIYSQTGNTHSVALRLKEKLIKAGYLVNLDRLCVIGGYKQGMRDIQFETLPDVEKYDAFVFGSPVHAFSLSQVMTAYLKQIEYLNGNKVALFVTKQLPFNWTGGTQAVKKMRKICETKGGIISGSGIVIWSSKNRERMITDLTEKICRLFSIP
jgi:menaquinone-dependent protoporphyrinogen IX oxidase